MPPAPGGGTPARHSTEFALGVLTYSTYLLGSLSTAVRGLSFIPLLVLALLLVLRIDRFRAPPPLLLFLLAFLAWYLASYLFSDKTGYSHFKIGMTWLKVVPLMLIPCFLKDREEDFFRGVFGALVAFMIVAAGQSIFRVRSVSINARLDFGVFNSIWIARAAFECFLIGLVVLRLPRRTLLLLFGLALLVTYVAGSKGPLVSLAAALAFWKLTDARIPRVRRLVAVGLLAALPIGAYLAAARSLSAESYLVQRFLRAVPEGSSDEVMEQSRLFTWPITVQKIASQDPLHLLLGQGVGNYGSLYFGQQFQERTYPHNIVLEFAAEQGLVFTATLALFIAVLLARRRSDFRVLLVFCLMNAMVSGDIPLNEYVFFYLAWTLVSRGGIDWVRRAPADDALPPAPRGVLGGGALPVVP